MSTEEKMTFQQAKEVLEKASENGSFYGGAVELHRPEAPDGSSLKRAIDWFLEHCGEGGFGTCTWTVMPDGEAETECGHVANAHPGKDQPFDGMIFCPKCRREVIVEEHVKPCPLCECSNLIEPESFFSGNIRITCGRCGVCGPWSETQEQARENWNDLIR